jgi:hypothetical protein
MSGKVFLSPCRSKKTSDSPEIDGKTAIKDFYPALPDAGRLGGQAAKKTSDGSIRNV